MGAKLRTPPEPSINLNLNLDLRYTLWPPIEINHQNIPCVLVIQKWTKSYLFMLNALQLKSIIKTYPVSSLPRNEQKVDHNSSELVVILLINQIIHGGKFTNINDTFYRVIGILVN